MSAHPEPVAAPGATTGARMRSTNRYQVYQPRRRWAWWNANRHYQIYMLREGSAFFCLVWAINQLRAVRKVSAGESAYKKFVAEQRSPGWVAFNAVGYGFLAFHAFTWWKLLGGLDLVKLGDRKVAQDKVTLGAFGAWGVVSLVLALIHLFGGHRGR